uniref:Uncharacterized protein n=1 Tax=Pyxicephalus adspersus TaxID=30357 RepID=A0AAV3B3N8_PYXAD|nr:TPA: hypothetical protein GDO54_006140 [Pyxicephalus adspersus]
MAVRSQKCYLLNRIVLSWKPGNCPLSCVMWTSHCSELNISGVWLLCAVTIAGFGVDHSQSFPICLQFVTGPPQRYSDRH